MSINKFPPLVWDRPGGVYGDTGVRISVLLPDGKFAQCRQATDAELIAVCAGQIPRLEDALYPLLSPDSVAWTNGTPDWTLTLDKKALYADDHTTHGRALGPDDGPECEDCTCRGSSRQAECAVAGCGFCLAAATKGKTLIERAEHLLGINAEEVAAQMIAEQPSGDTSNVTAELIRQLTERDATGRKKYGATLDRGDLTLEQWLQHMTEELLDGAGYAQAALRRLKEDEGVKELSARKGRAILAAGRELLAAMRMQEGRMREEFHIPRDTATQTWINAKNAWAAATGDEVFIATTAAREPVPVDVYWDSSSTHFRDVGTNALKSDKFFGHWYERRGEFKSSP